MTTTQGPEARPALPAPATTKPNGAKAPAPTVVPELTAISVSMTTLQAALHCVSKEESRYYLCGVYLHRTADGWLRCVSTDGHRLFVANIGHVNTLPTGEKCPDWLADGVIVPADMLKARLAMIRKCNVGLDRDRCRIAFAKGAGRLEVSDNVRENVFRIQPIEGTFPDYQKLILTLGGRAFTGENREDFEPVAFSPQLLASVGTVAKELGAKGVQLYVARTAPLAVDEPAKPDAKAQPKPGAKPDAKAEPKPGPKVDPSDSCSVVAFEEVDGVVMYVMPRRHAGGISEQNRAILAPVVKASVAALRAHLTRNEAALKKATGPERARLTEAVASFKARIAAVIERAGNGTPALPAPPKPPAAAPKIIAPAGAAQAPKAGPVVVSMPPRQSVATKPADKPEPAKAEAPKAAVH